MKSTIAAIDFGTSKIVTLVAETSGSQRCDIVGAGISMYDGFLDGEWNNTMALNEAIQKSISEAENQSKRKIREINVGVPGEFTRVYAVETSVTIQGADPRVTPRHVEKIFANADKRLSPVRGVVVHRSPAWFMVDGGKKTLEPVGLKGNELKALVSFVVADTFFLDDVMARLRDMNITVSGFFSSSTGEAMLYLLEEDRDRTALLIDVGYLCTDVMAVEGDAVIFQKTLPVGGGHIAADVAEGGEVAIEKMTTSTRKATIKKAMKGIGLTDEAVLSGYGNPVGEANTQLAQAIAAKVDNDCMDALQTASLIYDGSQAQISYNAIVDAVDLFEEEMGCSDKVLFIHPKQVTQLRKNPDFLSADKYTPGVSLTGEIGMIAGCRLVPSKKVPLAEGVYACPIVKLEADPCLLYTSPSPRDS